MPSLDKVSYTARTHTTGGREGASRSDDGRLDLVHSRPGGAGNGTNPEQLFAAGYSACYMGALRFHAGARKIAFPADASVEAECDVGPTNPPGSGFGLAVRMKVSLPGLDRETAQALVDAAHQTCPYSRAVSGNIPVELTLS